MITKAQKATMKNGIAGIDGFKFHGDGTITAWHSYFYGIGMSPEVAADFIREEFPDITVLDSGNHYHNFVGGAKSGSAKDSFIWVKFKINGSD